MKVSDYIGRKIDMEKFEDYADMYIDDEPGKPYYKIFLESELDSNSTLYGNYLYQYSLNLFLDDDSRIVKIERDRAYLPSGEDPNELSYPLKRMPEDFEEEADEILKEITNIE